MREADALGYFPPSTDECPTFLGDSSWEPLLDGARYLPALSELLDKAGSGDTVTIAGLELDPAVDLDGRAPDEEGYDPLGMRLARLAADGVDVRILLASRVWASSVPGTFFGGFRATARHAEALRTLRPTDPVTGERSDAAPPLAGRVLLDHSGALLGSNHQKAVAAQIGGELTAFVGGIDLVTQRFDRSPHDRLRLDGARWGWHDAAVRVRGRAARQVWTALRLRWIEASTLPAKHYLRDGRRPALLNPDPAVPPPDPAPETPEVGTPRTAVRILRSAHERKIDSLLAWRRRPWQVQPAGGYREVFDTLRHAIGVARRYVYLEDQYLSEAPGGDPDYELFPLLRQAAARGVKVILVGSGIRDPEDTGLHLLPINRTLNDDLKRVVEPLDAAQRGNLAVYRVEHLTVHAKIVLIDDVFASIGSANMFSRSMLGTDSELCAAVTTTTSLVRDLRVAAWADHLRAPADAVRPALEDLDTALGIWRPEWSSAGDPLGWRAAQHPAGFVPTERVLRLIGP